MILCTVRLKFRLLTCGIFAPNDASDIDGAGQRLRVVVGGASDGDRIRETHNAGIARQVGTLNITGFNT